jgi:hypothetical protein
MSPKVRTVGSAYSSGLECTGAAQLKVNLGSDLGINYRNSCTWKRPFPSHITSILSAADCSCMHPIAMPQPGLHLRQIRFPQESAKRIPYLHSDTTRSQAHLSLDNLSTSITACYSGTFFWLISWVKNPPINTMEDNYILFRDFEANLRFVRTLHQQKYLI